MPISCQGRVPYRRIFSAVACAAFLSNPVFAQQAPDAGQLLQQQPRPAVPVPVLPGPVTPATPVQDDDAAPRIEVSGFRISGAVLIGEAELQAQLAPLVGQSLSLRQLQGAAAMLTAYYVDKGYLARVIIPPQKVVDGVVILQITEGKRGSYQFLNDDPALQPRLSRYLDHHLLAEPHLNLRRLGEALMIMNEQPGLEVRSSLKAGAGESEIDLLIQAEARRYADYTLSANNHGARATGEAQLSGGITAHNPLGLFDQLNLLANFSEGTGFARIDYSLPLGVSGLRMGINGSSLDYELVQDSFSALDAHGSAQTMGVMLSYPLARLPTRQLTLSLAYDDKRMEDHTVAGEVSNKALAAATLGLNALFIGQPDNWLGHGVLNTTLQLISGDSEQKNAGAAASDEATRRSLGRYTKFAYSLSHLYPLSAQWSLNTSLRGQFADQNLDSTERMSLGGPSGVRAYPVGEASGDDGWLASLNFGKQFKDNLSASLFIDAGSIRLNHTTWANWNASNPDLQNTYTLYGVGAGVDWRINKAWLLSSSIANPIGSNPGADSNDRNVDDSENRARGWINLSAKL